MAIDYRERRVVNKNKPHRQPIGMYIIGAIAIVALVFASGFAGGWFASRYMMKRSESLQQASALPAQTPPAPGREALPPAAPGGQQPPLTFYETLPKGGKGVIGSGINAGLQEQKAPAPPKPAVPPQAAPAPPSAPAPAPAPSKPAAVAPPVAPPPAQPAAEKPKAQTLPSDAGKRFTVQVASVKDKAEAESLRNKLTAKGLNPMIIQVNIPEKGVVFRVRAGRHMQQREAQELAAKLGSGAIAVPE